ncbi:unnamed protein product [Allacma fusca]|uniref:Uncharacterized protein n=1 Tax=Allacma fusca TaxID=39272 RepID=A0A8J2KQJ1_9HEXA|nr:unnamed protein product [Allacma fusca]
MEKKVAAEKLRIRAEAKKSVKKVSASHSILPEVEALLADQLSNFSTSDSFDIGSKTVTISNVDTIKPVILDGNNSDDSEDEDNEDTPEAHPHLNAIKTKTLLKKSTNRLLQNSKVYKAAQRLKQKKSKHHQRHPPGKNSKDSKVDPKASAEVAGKQFRGKPQKSRGRRGRGKK